VSTLGNRGCAGITVFTALKRGLRLRVVVALPAFLLPLVLTGCGGPPPGAEPATTRGATGSPEASGTGTPTGAAEVIAVVSGRKVVGGCTGLNSGRPTVLLEVGMGSPKEALAVVHEHLGKVTQVCTYDRAGKGSSDPSSVRPRPVAEVISDADAFLAQAAKQGAEPPYFLVGQSFGGEVVIQYAQAHPDQVAGFVSINPSPPYKTWLKRARTVQTEAEIREFELPFPRGDNEEAINTTSNESMLTGLIPADLPYAVMFDEECGALPPPLRNKADCRRMIDLLELTAKDLANVGKGGSYVRVEGAGHDIQDTKPDAVLSTIDKIWTEALAR
jgi:pimeloyl-ACP methyl ester carboxylesterase